MNTSIFIYSLNIPPPTNMAANFRTDPPQTTHPPSSPDYPSSSTPTLSPDIHLPHPLSHALATPAFSGHRGRPKLRILKSTFNNCTLRLSSTVRNPAFCQAVPMWAVGTDCPPLPHYKTLTRSQFKTVIETKEKKEQHTKNFPLFEFHKVRWHYTRIYRRG